MTDDAYSRIAYAGDKALKNGTHTMSGLDPGDALTLRTRFYNFRVRMRKEGVKKYDKIIVNITPNGLLFRKKP